MSAGALLAARAGLWAGRLLLAAPDPLPPVDQDPDDVQDAACRIVERSPEVCRPPTTQTVPRSTSSPPSGWTKTAGATTRPPRSASSSAK